MEREYTVADIILTAGDLPHLSETFRFSMEDDDKDNDPWLNSLFGCSTSSSSEEQEKIICNNDECAEAEEEENVDFNQITFHDLSRNRRIKIVEKTIGGSIETMLWPSAQYLTEFILNYVKQTECGRIKEKQTAAVAASMVTDEICFDETDEKGCAESDNSANLCQTLSTQNKKSHYYLKESLRKTAALEALNRLIFEFNPLIIPPNRPNIEDAQYSNRMLKIIELGAGVGLTGIMLASELRCRVLLTDLNEALPLLHENIQINRENFIASSDAVSVEALHWGTDEWKSCLRTDDSNIADDGTTRNNENARVDSNQFDAHQNILVLASDCVYFEELHAPFEHTIASILSAAPPGSMCLVAGVRRWKRDTSFFSHIGKVTKTETHHLQCVCVQETITNKVDDNINGEVVTKRVIMRIYAIQWMRRISM